MTIAIGDQIPDLTVKTTQNEALELRNLKGKALVLYFYPKDNTPGCTTQGQAFRDAYPQFQTANAEILGVSRESIRSHQNFINKHEFPFDLISDPDEELCNAMDVIKEKNMYGRKYMGIVRSTFIFDKDGKLRHEIRNVKVKGHVDEVLALVESLD
ncbi:peroxiredoxin [Arenicella chitinivorans]|uniref:thioredoxin-dependent peroxiredoxin n=1 Tax=Arenicella chitinivorans TaxID=1329800 RepID=A0A918VKU6_9GAMM|nr:peroxiredoxin [Arenicella chitinivorans]GHA05710.1 peroxiredoxin [Arenicella chitinivorans]